MDALAVAVALNGEIVRRDQVLCPGPGHSPHDRSLSVRLDPSAPDGFVRHSFSPRNDWRECRDYVRRALGLARREPAPRSRTPPVAHPYQHGRRDCPMAAVDRRSRYDGRDILGLAAPDATHGQCRYPASSPDRPIWRAQRHHGRSNAGRCH